MDLHKAFVSAVLAGGVEAYKKAVERGIGPEFLEEPGKSAWLFVCEYYNSYKDLPSFEAVYGRTNVQLGAPPKEPVDFYIDEVRNLRLWIQVSRQVENVSGSLASKNPQEAYEKYAAGLTDLRKEGIAVSKTELLPSLGPQFLDYYDKIKEGMRGVETPWPTVNDATLGFWPEDFVLYVARLGVGKCVASDTVIVDPRTGVPFPISEVFHTETFSDIMTWSKDKGIHVAPITAKVDTGTARCLKVTTETTGRTITVTPEHPFLTPAGWLRADKLEPGMMVGLPMSTPLPSEPVCVDEALLDILTLVYAFSVSSGDEYIKLHILNKADAEILTRSARVFDYFVIQYQGVYGVFPRGPALTNAFNAYGVWNAFDAGKQGIPAFAWRLNSGQLSRFIGMLWRFCGTVSLNSVSVECQGNGAAKELQSLLLRLGVQSKVEEAVLRVLVSHHRCFFENVWLVPEQKRAAELLIVKDVWALRDAPVKKKKPRRDALSSMLSRFKKRFLPKSKSVVAPPTKKDHRWVWNSGLFWDVVGTIHEAGDTKIYDLTVSPSACFVANDFVVHNTWTLAQIMVHAWEKEKKRVLFVTTEMSKEKILQRMFALHCKLPYEDLRRGRLGEVAEARLREGVQELKSREGLYIVGGGFDFTMDSLEAAIEECEPDICIVDGAYLIKTSGDGRTERAANSFDELKRCAKRNKIPLVASTQFNREAKTNSSDSVSVEKIALSDAAGWNADLIFGLVQTEEMKGAARMIQKPLKFREGVGQDIICNWDFETMDFSEIAKDHDVSRPSQTPVRRVSAGSGSLFSDDSENDEDAVPF